jgi:1A family penicillin-binding protein
MPRPKRKKQSLRKHLENPNPHLRVAFVAAGILFVLAGIGVLFIALRPIPDLNNFDSRKVAQSTKIYDRTGKTVLYDLNHDVRRNIVPLSEISVNLQKATLAIEDANFYSHIGISFRGIARAIVTDITTLSFAQGGSTLTQQVVKNTILTGQKNITRKVQEVILAIKLEQKYSKEQILEFYFNVTPYGGTIYGAEVASKVFFGKSANSLTVAEAAYLAAIPQLPTYYSPYGNNREALDARKNIVLQRMRELGYITEKEFTEAKAERVVFSRQQNNSILAPHFVFYIEQQLETKYGSDVATQGLTVITTLDADLQHEAETIVNRYALSNQSRFNASNAALVAIDPKTGQILSMVGSRDYFDPEIDGNFNAALALRQPGSAFKPFVYAAALKKGYTTQTAVFDVPTQFSTSCSPTDIYNSTYPCYSPSNYDNKFRGQMTFTTALAQSINIPAVKALYLAGMDNVLSLGEAVGITTLGSAKEYGLSLALGAAEVKLLEITGAFAVLGNDGVRNPPVGILEIRDKRGSVLERFVAAPQQVLDVDVARGVSAMLSDNQARQPEYPPENPFFFPDYDVAAKTGTTNESRDAWTIGYTPSIAVGVWAGNNNNTPMVKETAGYIVAPMWREFMLVAISKTPKEFFNEPPAISDNLPPALRGIGALTLPDGSRVSHSILHWTNKDNPRGGAPGNPASDPQYRHWEYPIQLWSAMGGTISGKPEQVPATTTPTQGE